MRLLHVPPVTLVSTVLSNVCHNFWVHDSYSDGALVLAGQGASYACVQ